MCSCRRSVSPARSAKVTAARCARRWLAGNRTARRSVVRGFPSKAGIRLPSDPIARSTRPSSKLHRCGPYPRLKEQGSHIGESRRGRREAERRRARRARRGTLLTRGVRAPGFRRACRPAVPREQEQPLGLGRGTRQRPLRLQPPYESDRRAPCGSAEASSPSKKVDFSASGMASNIMRTASSAGVPSSCSSHSRVMPSVP